MQTSDTNINLATIREFYKESCEADEREFTEEEFERFVDCCERDFHQWLRDCEKYFYVNELEEQ